LKSARVRRMAGKFVLFDTRDLILCSRLFFCAFLLFKSFVNTRRSTSVLARYNTVALCVCLSVASRYYIETTGRVLLVFGMFAFIHLSYNVLQEKSGSSKNKCTFPWNCTSWTLDLEKFRYGKSIVLLTKLVDSRACSPHVRRSPRRG